MLNYAHNMSYSRLILRTTMWHHDKIITTSKKLKKLISTVSRRVSAVDYSSTSQRLVQEVAATVFVIQSIAA